MHAHVFYILMFLNSSLNVVLKVTNISSFVNIDMGICNYGWLNRLFYPVISNMPNLWTSHIYIYFFSPPFPFSFFKKEEVWSLLTLAFLFFLPEEVPFGLWDRNSLEHFLHTGFYVLGLKTAFGINIFDVRCALTTFWGARPGGSVCSLKTFDELTSSFFQYEKKDSKLRFNLEVLRPSSLGSPGWDAYVLSLWSEWSVSAPGSHWHHQCPVQT